MAISASGLTSSLTGTTSLGGGATGSAKNGGSLGSVDFLKLLTTQMRYQNPLDPMKDSESVAQLAQFSSLQGIQQLNANFADMLLLQGLTQGANLIGKTVVYDKGSSVPGRGVVESVKVQNGSMQLVVSGATVNLNQVRGLEGTKA